MHWYLLFALLAFGIQPLYTYLGFGLNTHAGTVDLYHAVYPSLLAAVS